MKAQWQQLRVMTPVLVLALASGCVGMATKEMVAKSMAQAQKQPFYNCYTRQNYETVDESYKATREYFNKELARVTPLGKSLNCKALIIIPSVTAIRNEYDKTSKLMEDSLRTEIPDYDQTKARMEKFKQDHPEFPKSDARLEQIKNHYPKMEEIRFATLAEALKRRKIFSETVVQKTNELGTRHASAPPSYGCTIYLVSRVLQGKAPRTLRTWFLKTPGSEDPVMIGPDEAINVNAWLSDIGKTAQEQLKNDKP
jgi:hypothetical protein